MNSSMEGVVHTDAIKIEIYFSVWQTRKNIAI